jgi:hypothetical protein
VAQKYTPKIQTDAGADADAVVCAPWPAVLRVAASKMASTSAYLRMPGSAWL